MLCRMFCVAMLIALSLPISALAQESGSPVGLTARPGPEVVFLWPTGSSTLQGVDEKEITTPADLKPGQRIRTRSRTFTIRR